MTPENLRDQAADKTCVVEWNLVGFFVYLELPPDFTNSSGILENVVHDFNFAPTMFVSLPNY